jgi:hypothetical protein
MSLYCIIGVFDVAWNKGHYEQRGMRSPSRQEFLTTLRNVTKPGAHYRIDWSRYTLALLVDVEEELQWIRFGQRYFGLRSLDPERLGHAWHR